MAEGEDDLCTQGGRPSCGESLANINDIGSARQPVLVDTNYTAHAVSQPHIGQWQHQLHVDADWDTEYDEFIAPEPCASRERRTCEQSESHAVDTYTSDADYTAVRQSLAHEF